MRPPCTPSRNAPPQVATTLRRTFAWIPLPNQSNQRLLRPLGQWWDHCRSGQLWALIVGISHHKASRLCELILVWQPARTRQTCPLKAPSISSENTLIAARISKLLSLWLLYIFFHKTLLSLLLLYILFHKTFGALKAALGFLLLGKPQKDGIANYWCTPNAQQRCTAFASLISNPFLDQKSGAIPHATPPSPPRLPGILVPSLSSFLPLTEILKFTFVLCCFQLVVALSCFFNFLSPRFLLSI